MRFPALWGPALFLAVALITPGCSDTPPSDDDDDSSAGQTEPPDETSVPTGTPAGTDVPTGTPSGTDAPTGTPGGTEDPNGGPDLELSSSAIDFGTVAVGQVGEATITLSNAGDERLNLTIEVDGDGFGIDPEQTVPTRLNPGEDVDLRLQFSPLTASSSTGVLTIVSNDPDEPTAEVQLSGAGEEGDPEDLDGDGFTREEGDCDDDDDAVYPGAAEICDGADNDCDNAVDEDGESSFYADDDQDGAGDPSDPVVGCNPPEGYVANDGDCDDADASVYTGAAEQCDLQDNDCDDQIDEGVTQTFYNDADGDGHGDAKSPVQACFAGDGQVASSDDCNDDAASVYPGATETCDTVDNDCDSQVDEGASLTFYLDADSDGYGRSGITASACTAPSGYVAESGDCNDLNADVNPGETERCNSIDDDCDAQIDEDVLSTWYKDADGDTYGASGDTVTACSAPSGYTGRGGDCNDAVATVYPGAAEICDGADNDCDSQIDEDGQPTWYADGDGDGYGRASSTLVACQKPSGYAAQSGDCDDTDAGVNPGAGEECNGVDDNCDGQIDEGVLNTYYFDDDGDGFGDDLNSDEACTLPGGYVEVGGDCNDDSPSVNPDATELCDSVDNNCDGQVDTNADDAPTWYEDQDEDDYGSGTAQQSCSQPDGYVPASGDCDDNDPDINPATPELPANGVDENCDGKDQPSLDLDHDGYADMIVVNRVSGSTYKLNSTIHWGSPTGISATDKTDLATQGANAACVADFDEDGWLDIVFANYASASSTYAVDSYLYWGSPIGFSASDRTDLPTLGAFDCHVSDLDADGDTDIVFANHYSGSSYAINSYVYWNDNGAFSRSNKTELATLGAYAVTSADLNNDGRQDLIFSNYRNGSTYAQNSYVYLGAPTGYSTGSRLNLATIGAWRKATVADFNKDGTLDIFMNNHYNGSSYNVNSTLYWGPGYVTKTDIATNGNSGSLARDFDKDGYLDLAIGSYYDGDNSTSSYVWYGSSKGFETANRVSLATNRVYDLATDDLNDDGYLDLVVATYTDGDYAVNSVVFWGSASRFATSNRLNLATTGSTSVEIGDLDGDDYLDLAFGSAYDGDNVSTGHVYWGSARGIAETHRSDYPSLGANHVNTGDLNKDGYPDLVIANRQGTTTNFQVDTYIYWGAATGVSTSNVTKLAALGASWTCIADYNNDGWQDVAIANFRDNSTHKVDSYIYWGSAGGYSTSNRTGLPTLGAQHCLATDMEGDGDLDLIFSNYYNDTSYSVDSYIYMNTAGTFSTASRVSLPTIGAYAAAAADIDKNGFKDVLFSNYYSGSSYNIGSYLYFGDATGYSATRRQTLASHGPFRESLIEDLNKDGYPDILIPGSYDGDNSVNTYLYLGGASGYSDSSRVTFALNRVAEVKAADLDKDGWKDLVFATYYDGDESNNSYVYWGSSAGYSAGNRITLPANRSYGVHIADLNADGYLDVTLPTWYDADYAATSYVYYGSSTGFSTSRRATLNTNGASYATSADFDRDGLLDLAFANTRSGTSSSYSFSTPSNIYWSSLRGLSSSNATTFASTGSYDLVVVRSE